MRLRSLLSLTGGFSAPVAAGAYAAPDNRGYPTRRAFLASAAVTTTTAAASSTTTTEPAWALDVDAFADRELASDNDSTGGLSEDAALCRYGSPSPETGEACVRAGLPTTRVAGGVDAFGKANRGDFVRCKQFYENDDRGNYVKKTVCDGDRR